MIEIYEKLKEKSKLEILFMIFFIFGSQVVLAISIIFLILIMFQEKNKKGKIKWENILFLLKEGVFYKFLLSIVYPYENIATESFRGIILIFLIDVFYKRKCKEFELKNKIGIISLGFYILGIVWNYFSLGGVESIKVYIEINKFLLLPLVLGSLYFETNEKEEKIRYIEYTLPLAMVGYFFDRIDFDKIKYSMYVMKGGMISISSTIIPFSVYFCLEKKDRREKIIYLLVVLINVYLVIKSSARAGLYSFLISIFLVAILSQKIKNILKICIILCLFVFSLDKVFNIQERMFRYTDLSTRSREYLIRAGVYSYSKSPVFGVGSGNTQKYFIEYAENGFLENNRLKNQKEIQQVKEKTLKKFPDTHNIIFDFIAENGVYGAFFSILLFFMLPCKMLCDYLKKKSSNLLKYVGGVLGFIISGQAWSIWTRHNQGVIYLIIIITIYFYKVKKEER